MPDDTGRNDPCPCGSGAKYKHCCLRKKKERRDRDSWKDKFKRLNDPALYDFDRPSQEVLEPLTELWSLVVQQLQPSDKSLTDVERRLGFPSADALAALVEVLALNHSQGAMDAGEPPDKTIEFIDSVFDQFTDLEEETATLLHQIRCEAYSRAGRYDEAFEEAQMIIELRPDSALGRLYAADVLRDDPDGDLSKAVALLEEAAEGPDADEYTAQKELEDMKRHRTELEGETELVRMRAKCERLQEEIEMLKSMTKWLEENRED